MVYWYLNNFKILCKLDSGVKKLKTAALIVLANSNTYIMFIVFYFMLRVFYLFLFTWPDVDMYVTWLLDPHS